MSIKLIVEVWKSREDLLPSEKFVLLFLAYCANDANNLLCCPSLQTIAENCNLSRSQVKRILRNLAASNLITKIPQLQSSNNFKSNHYSINIPFSSANDEGGGRVAHDPRGRVAHDPRVGSSTTPNNISNNEHIKKENNIKEIPPSAPEDHRSSVLRSTAKLVIDFLRQKTGRNYQHAETTLKPIIQLLKEGITLEQCKAVIVKKQREWGNNKEMEKYLRPSTLFRKSNFYDKYLPELVTEEEKKNIMKST